MRTKKVHNKVNKASNSQQDNKVKTPIESNANKKVAILIGLDSPLVVGHEYTYGITSAEILVKAGVAKYK